MLVGVILGPATLVTALAYYSGWRREREFAGHFGIDPSVLAAGLAVGIAQLAC